MSSDDPTSDLDLFHEKLRQDCLRGCEIACYLILTVFSAFFLLDVMVIPKEWLVCFGLIRFVVCFQALLILFFIKRFRTNLPVKPQYLGIYIGLSVGFAVVLMVMLNGGHQSSYYAGISLIIIGVAISIPIELRYNLLFNAILYSGYVFSNLIFDRITNVPLFISNSAFMFGNVLFALVTVQIGNTFRKDNFFANLYLERLNTAKSQFFANVSHELKTPTALVLTPLENVLRQAPPTAADLTLSRSTLTAVCHNAHRLSSLIGDLLDLTRSEVGKARLQAAPVTDASDHFRGIFESMEPLMREKGVEGEWVVGKDAV